MLKKWEFLMIDFFCLLIGHIKPTEEPKQWLPIMVLVWLIWKWKKQVQFWIDREHPLFHQTMPEQLHQL